MPDRILNPQQKAAITYGKGPLLIIAGAGTGKTTVITERIKSLITNYDVNPSEVLALTFTEKAATEMETRIDEGLPYGYSQLWIQTFHGFCDRILKAEAIHIGLNPRFDLLTEAETLMFLRKHLFEFELKYFRPLGNPLKFIQGMLTHFSRLRDDDINPDDYLKYAKKLAKEKNIDGAEIEKTLELAKAFKKYEELKSKEGVMDFSDLISNTLMLFRTRKNMLGYYQNKFKYILVDEFQDTNFAQNELAILLAGDLKNITVVGDDDQAVYRWRGAALANMMQFKSHFPKAKIITLTKNYRSTQSILDTSYKMIQNNNPYRLEIQEKIEKKLTGERALEGESVDFLYGKNADEEAELIATKIKEDVKNNKRGYRDFAILVRANDHSLPFQRALERKKIPFQFLGPGKLFQQEIIKDLIAYLRVLSNFDDTSSLYRVITNPIFSFDEVTIATLMNASKKFNKSLFKILEIADTLDLSDEAKRICKRLVTMMKHHLSMVPKENAGQILYSFFEESGLLGHYLDPGTTRTEEEAQNIAKFFERLQSYTSNHDDASVFAIVDWIDLSMDLGESPQAAEIDWSENNAVNILTVHSSKGLEFPVVFVVNLVTQRFPSRDRKEQLPIPDELVKEQLPQNGDNLQEERRLFYVAMTRARDKLYLSAAKFYGDGKRERKISPFVYEALGEDTVDAILSKQKHEDAAEQLSLLEALKPVVSEKETKDNTLSISNKPLAINYISYSQLQTFDICPLHYKLRYIMKVPSAPSSALSYGISVHSMLKYLYEEGFGKTKLSNDVLGGILKKSWVSEGYESREHEEMAKQAAKSLLLKFMEDNQNGVLPYFTEYPFQFFLKNVKVLGRFDRIDKIDEKTIEIVDYKTGENIPDEKKLKKDLQMTLYALAATQLKDPVFERSPEKIKLTLYYVEKNTRVSTWRTSEDIENAKVGILEKIHSISTSDFRCSRSILCKTCEYKMLCSTYSN